MFRIKIIDKYLSRETYNFFLLGVIAITIMMTVETLFELMELLIDKGVSIDKVLKILIYRLPAFMVVT
ncbi:MAG TPA: LptF/LptG family permease, partial [Candidatus Atribacteria bacterium]|nr:LptF/LptG family permease [Candidatus Atribacteria bacterium]